MKREFKKAKQESQGFDFYFWEATKSRMDKGTINLVQ